MALDPKERAALAEDIWRSVDQATQIEIDTAWAHEAEDRIAAYDRGEIEAEPVEDVIHRLKDRPRP